jgi:hypothetical protein
MDVKNDIINAIIMGIAGKIWISDIGKYIGLRPSILKDLNNRLS